MLSKWRWGEKGGGGGGGGGLGGVVETPGQSCQNTQKNPGVFCDEMPSFGLGNGFILLVNKRLCSNRWK